MDSEIQEVSTSDNVQYFDFMCTNMELITKPEIPDDIETMDLNTINEYIVNFVTMNSSIEELSDLTKENIDISLRDGYFKSTAKEDIRGKISSLTSNSRYHRSDARNSYDTYIQYLQRVSEAEVQISTLKRTLDTLGDNDVDETMVDSIKAICADGKWEFLGYKKRVSFDDWHATRDDEHEEIRSLRNGSFRFYTGFIFASKEDVICSINNPAAGLDLSLNFGKPMVCFDKSGNIKNVAFYENAIFTGADVIHPHSTGTSVCWGNASSVYEGYVLDATCRFKETLDLLINNLSNYCEDNPYRTLTSFITLSDKYDRVNTLQAVNFTNKLLPDIFKTPEIEAKIKFEEDTKLALESFRSDGLSQNTEEFYSAVKTKLTEIEVEFQNGYGSDYNRMRSSDTASFEYQDCVEYMLNKETCEKLIGVNLGLITGLQMNKNSIIFHSMNHHDLLKEGDYIFRRGHSDPYKLTRTSFVESSQDYTKIYGLTDSGSQDHFRTRRFEGVINEDYIKARS